MKSTTLDEQAEVGTFVLAAAKAFAAQRDLATFAHALEPGRLLALRWGITERGVLVVRLSPDFEPVNYVDAVS